jgi:hypothetical protein
MVSVAMRLVLAGGREAAINYAFTTLIPQVAALAGGHRHTPEQSLIQVQRKSAFCIRAGLIEKLFLPSASFAFFWRIAVSVRRQSKRAILLRSNVS